MAAAVSASRASLAVRAIVFVSIPFAAKPLALAVGKISVATDGTVTDGPYRESKEHLGGFAVVDVPSREEALEWAAKIAVACRCAQEVRELLPDPTV